MGQKRKHLEKSSGSKKKKRAKRPRIEDVKTSETQLSATRRSDDVITPLSKWTNRTRVLVFASRGVSSRDRHLMNDLRDMMPHSKSDTKMDRKDKLFVINEICEMKNCRKCVYFEAKKKKDLYMWVSNTPRGPSVKFLVENVHTMLELNMTGNCLKGSRPILSFDKEFDTTLHWKLIKEIFCQTFSTPSYHPKSKPFYDHVFTFSIADGRIWFRNFQILEENGELVEIGPRMVLNPIRIFKGSFGGETMYENPNYQTPNHLRSLVRKAQGMRYVNKVAAQQARDVRRPDKTYETDPSEIIFRTS